ncbi:MAG: NADH-quinone oxidoreductase subunit A [Thermodesulfobacteriota bacterium]
MNVYPILWPFAVHLFAVLALIAGILVLSRFLGETHRQRATGEPYESGTVISGSAQLPVDAKFYLIAVFFVIFDLETLFIMAWALGVREAGWIGYVEAVVFIGVLLAGLVYLWRVGALHVGASTDKGSVP